MTETFEGYVTSMAGREGRDGKTVYYSASIHLNIPKGTMLKVGAKLKVTVALDEDSEVSS